MLKKIKLENFRNHSHFELELSKITAIIGPNGTGKSNILESVALLSQCRSFREEDKKNLVNYDADYCRVVGDHLEVFIQKAPTYISKAKEKNVFKRQSEFIGLLKSVIFSPETLNIITGSPKNRRRFLDIVLSQTDREYLKELIRYEKVKKERNSLLQAIYERRSKEEELDFWDKEIAESGEFILKRRKEFLESLSDDLSKIYREISNNDDKLVIEYKNTVDGNYLEELKKNHQKEIILKKSLIGPHRDDLVFLLSGYNMQNYSSRGEIRTAILALKIAELNFLCQKGSSDDIILLLDDVFSEFDEERRKHLGKLILQYQTIITTTDREHLSEELLNNCKLVEL